MSMNQSTGIDMKFAEAHQCRWHTQPGVRAFREKTSGQQ